MNPSGKSAWHLITTVSFIYIELIIYIFLYLSRKSMANLFYILPITYFYIYISYLTIAILFLIIATLSIFYFKVYHHPIMFNFYTLRVFFIKNILLIKKYILTK